MAASAFDRVVEQSHLAWGDFVKGDPEPAKRLFSRRADVTLGNPFGPFARGWAEVAATMERAAAHYRDGEVVGFEPVAQQAAGDLGYLVEVERYRAKVGGGPEQAPVALRVTSVLRREGGAWRIVHRHADPITAARPARSVVQE